MVEYVKGSDLPSALQCDALASYVNRYTRDHRPYWATTGNPDKFPNGVYPLQFDSDADWLANTLFPVSKSGNRLLTGDCQSSPTWPDNPELRRT